MKLLSILVALAAIEVHALAATNNLLFDLDGDFDKFVEALMSQLHVPGVSLALITRDKVTAKGYGLSQLPSTKATPDTLWFTGSTTKAFVAAAATKIVHNKTAFPDVKWSSPLSKLLPDDFALADDYYTSHITLEDALSHRSGLPRHDMAYGWDNATTIETIRTMRYMPLTAEPRTRWQYCNLMYATVGEIVQRLAGEKLETVLREWFWKPLKMDSTTFSVQEAQQNKDNNGDSKLAKGYFWTGDDFIPEAYTELSGLPGAGATISSVNDYALWMQAHLAAHAGPDSSSPITSSLYEAVTLPRSVTVPIDGLPTVYTPLYALGWTEMNIGRLNMIAHGGSVTGFGTQVYLLPEEGVGFVTMGNTMVTSNMLGALLFSAIVNKGLVSLTAQEQRDVEQLLQDDVLHAGTGPLPAFHSLNNTMASSGAEPKIPLPSELSDYAGLYLHPAYGAFNVSIASPSSPSPHKNSPSQTPLRSPNALPFQALTVQPSLRTWPFNFLLSHDSSSLFTSDAYWLHGENVSQPDCGVDAASGSAKLKCNNGVVPDLMDRGRAAFEYDSGGTVVRIGLELEAELVRQAQEDGGAENWRAGMIWFERLM